MIDYVKADKVAADHINVYIGDEDVLIGTTAAKSVVRVWFAPLNGKMEKFNEIVDMPKGFPVPPDAAVKLFFLNRGCLDAFITMLTRTRDAAFPLEKPEEKTNSEILGFPD